ADGAAFGTTGAYERVTGVARGELDPGDVRNRGIRNLDRAPKNARGMVEYDVDFDLLRPADPEKGNRKILFEINNRGRKFALMWLMDGSALPQNANNPLTAADAGNALFLKQGYTFAWTGWDPDAPTTNNGMTIRVPVATDGGKSIVRTIREELVSATRGPVLKDFRLSHEAASVDPSQARLTVRRSEKDARVEIPSSGWAYVNSRTIKLLPEGTGPQVGSLYEFVYPAKDPKVQGIGFAATRDFVSFLRYETKDAKDVANPAGAGIKAVLAVGISQSGRYLRDHIGQGFNQDEKQRKVFDGVLAHISGVGRVFLNEEFGEPARTNTQHEDHLYPENEFPFSTASMGDSISGRTGALFRNDGFDPLLIETNTSTEYWQKGASLLHTDTLGEQDVELPANARVFMMAGTQHGGRAKLRADFGPCVNERNPHDPSPALRALVVALDAWVSEGKGPPASRVPTFKDGTLVAIDKLAFPAIPDFAAAKLGNEVVAFGDWVNPKPGKIYRTLVSAIDGDGNEIAGVRLPDIVVPLATHTGWNLYKRPFTEGELCDRDGSYAEFASTKAAREAKKDPRPSLAERYGTHANFVGNVKKAADRLVIERLLLPDDAAAYVKWAESPAVSKRFAP
ncbi:MAG: alpha/beta hydrolase domain-containing protein, partial [Betaproteobacteria bacterium]